MATINFYLDHPKEKGSDKFKSTPVTIILKLYIDRNNRFDISVGEKIIPKYWDVEKERAKANHRGHVELNLELTRIKQELTQLWRDDKTVGIGALKSMAQSMVKFGQPTPPVQKKTFLEAYEKFLAQCSTEKKEATIRKFRSLQVKLTSFADQHALEFEILDFNFYDDFKAFLYAERNPNYPGQSLHPDGDFYVIKAGTAGLPIGLFDDSVFKYIVNLKTFLTWARKRGYPVNNSFESWKIIKRKHKPISLTLAELERLEATPMPTAAVALARDYLALESRTGQRISDLKRFDPNDYHEYKWTFTPFKGNRLHSKTVTVHFVGYCAPALLVLARYNFTMPKISEQKLNKNIKKACAAAGIDSEHSIIRWAGNKQIKITSPKSEFISTHTGKKTFITIALQYMPPKIVKELSNIESYETLKHYEDDAETSVIEKYLSGIQETNLMRKAQ